MCGIVTRFNRERHAADCLHHPHHRPGGAGAGRLLRLSAPAFARDFGRPPGLQSRPGPVCPPHRSPGTGAAGDLARAANALADDLEQRHDKAQQDKDHLLSLLAVLDHTNEIAIATDNDDMIRLVNPAAARVLRAHRGSPTGQTHRHRHPSPGFAFALPQRLLLQQAGLRADRDSDPRPHPPLPGHRGHHLQRLPITAAPCWCSGTSPRSPRPCR